MKKSSLLLLAAPALLLCGCGDGSSLDSNGVPQPSGGETVSLAQGANKLASAAKGTVAENAFGFSLSIPSFSTSVTSDHMSLSTSLAKATASFAVSGYSGTSIADLKAAFTAGFDSFNFSASMDTGMSEMPTSTSSLSVGKSRIGAYLSNGGLYVDISDSTLHEAIVSAVIGDQSVDASLISASIPGKVMLPDAIAAEDLPLIDLSEFNQQAASFASSLAANASSLDPFFTLKDYEDGTSTLYGEFTVETLASLTAAIEGVGDSSFDASAAVSSMLAQAGDAKLNFSFSLSYDASHILGLALGEDVSVKANVSQGGETSEAQIVSKGSFDLDFVYGQDANVSLPDDLSEYVPMTSSPASK
ncbi:MAG: hypothetical protein LKK13_01145 [Bacilli bacterium]|jgi:hypothetical protein|nr:hypothetical protein [Bacilli bacterium]